MFVHANMLPKLIVTFYATMRFLTKLSLFMEKDYPLPKLLVTCIEYQVWLNTNTTPKPQYLNTFDMVNLNTNTNTNTSQNANLNTNSNTGQNLNSSIPIPGIVCVCCKRDWWNVSFTSQCGAGKRATNQIFPHSKFRISRTVHACRLYAMDWPNGNWLCEQGDKNRYIKAKKGSMCYK